MRCHILAQGAVVAAFLGGVCAQLDSLSPCGVACVNNVIAKGFGCASGDNTCLCKQQDFVFGVRDCAAQSCTADESTKANDYVAGLCASICNQRSFRFNPAAIHTCYTAINTINGPFINDPATTASNHCSG
ncbi:CFEM domain-containing protein [Colletotrichum graminicola]|nr:CFEM domain-containing protein [Colletotrichum graminicola]